MNDPELHALERRLLRGVLVRRLVIGIGAIATGLALIVLAVVTAYTTIRGHYGRRSMLRTAILMALFGALAIAGGFVTLRVGEIRGDLSVHESEPVPWKAIGAAAAALAIALGLVVAWPLGVYDRLASLASPCREVLTSKDIETLAIAPFEIDHVTDHESQCALVGVEPGGQARVVLVEIDGPRSGYRFDDRIRAFRADRREAMEGIAEEALILERAGERMIAMKHPNGAIYVNLSARRYDEAQTRRIAEQVGARIALVEKLPAR